MSIASTVLLSCCFWTSASGPVETSNVTEIDLAERVLEASTMDNPAETQFPIHDLIANRWSPRSFRGKSVSPNLLSRCLEAARWAPSSFNEQPWGFLIATSESAAVFSQFLECLVEANQAWASKAPVLMLSVARLRFERNGKPNRHALHDVGSAMENFSLQAVAEGLVVHQMAGFDLEKARDTMNIPDGYEPVSMVAIGFPVEPDTLDQETRDRESAPRQRRPMREFTFFGTWGDAWETNSPSAP